VPVDATRPQLEIRPGLPVPILMRPSPNPASGGTYAIGRRYSVGDEIVYAESDLIFGTKLPDRVFRVTRVDEDADLVYFNDGMYIWDTMGNAVKSEKAAYDPRVQQLPAEFQIGRTWTTRYRTAAPGLISNEIYLDGSVVGREKVRVPAGEFDSFRVEFSGFNLTQGYRLTLRTWVVPGLNNFLRYEFTSRPRIGPPFSELREMVSCKQAWWSVA
jgi:hypothetical protein